MANEGNLKPFKKGDTDLQRKGGIASGEARRNRKAFRDRLELLYDMAVFPGEKTEVEDAGSITELSEQNTSVLDAMALRIVQMALGGDRDAIKLALQITGQLEPPQEAPEAADDGFLEALAGTAAQDWAEESDEEEQQ